MPRDRWDAYLVGHGWHAYWVHSFNQYLAIEIAIYAHIAPITNEKCTVRFSIAHYPHTIFHFPLLLLREDLSIENAACGSRERWVFHLFAFLVHFSLICMRLNVWPVQLSFFFEQPVCHQQLKFMNAMDRTMRTKIWINGFIWKLHCYTGNELLIWAFYRASLKNNGLFYSSLTENKVYKYITLCSI